MKVLLTLVALLPPAMSLALDGGLPLTTLEDGWLRVEADEPVTFRWAVDNPFVGVVEAELAAGKRSSMDDCVWPDSGGGPPRARLRVEVAAPEAAVELDLGQPAAVQLLGVFPDQGSLVAAFTASYSCTSLGASGTAEVVSLWWSAVRLAPSLAAAEHRHGTGSSLDHWYQIGPQVGISPGFEAHGGRLMLEVSVQPYLPDGRDGEALSVRWPVGEAPACVHPPASQGVGAAPKVVATFIEVAAFGSEDGSLGHVLADPFTCPMAFAVELRQVDGAAESLYRLPQFIATATLAGYAEVASAGPLLPTRDPAVEPKLRDGAYLAADTWPEARVACAAEFRPGAIERYARVEWTPLIEGKVGRLGLLSIPCQSWRHDEDTQPRRASWLIRSGSGTPTPVLAVASCGSFHSAFEDYEAPQVTVQVRRDQHRVRLVYDPVVEPDWLLANRSGQPAQGDLDHLNSRLLAARKHGGVAAVVVDLEGRVEIEPATSRWRETWTGRGDFAELRWTGQQFTAVTQEGERISSRDGVTWSAAPVAETTSGARPGAPQTPTLPDWVQGCPELANASHWGRIAAGNQKVMLAVGGVRGKMRAATSCEDATASRLPGCYFANAAIWTGVEFLVAGDGPCKECTGRLWSSPDGTTWQAETVPLGGPLTHLVASPDTVVVGGWGRLLSAPVAAGRAPERERHR